MNNDKPALIVNRNRRYEAFNQDGRMILQREKWHDAQEAVQHYGYFPVSLWSHTGKTIKDKIPSRICY
jgi:hypothetical protein